MIFTLNKSRINPEVSIIIPSYNNLNFLKDCIASIKNQTFRKYEVWIIDNNSDDETIDFLKTLESPFFWLCEHDNGIYDAMNKGINLAKGKWLFFLGADDKLYKNTTLDKIFTVKYEPNTKIILGNIEYQFLKEKKKKLFVSSWSSKIWFKNIVHHQSAFYKKELFHAQKFNTNYKILADYSLNLTFFKEKINVTKIDLTICTCSPYGVSKNKKWNQYKEEINLKTNASHIVLKPLFFTLSFFKFILK